MLSLLLPAVLLAPAWGAGAAHYTAPCNVVWTTPSVDAAGSLPLGNGQLGASVWVEADGGLRLYLCRSDSYSELSRLLKVGGLTVKLTPNPFGAADFRQELVLRDGVCTIAAGGVKLRVFVDAEHDVLHITGESAAPVAVTATVDCWRSERHVLKGEEINSTWTMHGAPYELAEAPDIFPPSPAGAVAWYHRNESTVVPATLKTQSLESVADKVREPLLGRTFGGWLTGAGLVAGEGHSLTTAAPTRAFSLRVACPCAQTPSAEAWLTSARELAATSADADAAFARTAAWWQAFWDRSRVVVTRETSLAGAVPGEQHPLRIGYDSAKGNHFPGTLGRTSVYGRALSPTELAKLAACDREQPPVVTDKLLKTGDGTAREIPHDQLDTSGGLTVEAWIKPDGRGVGRVFDKLTAGGSDGFLLDLFPADTLRLIVGSTQYPSPKGAVKAGAWHHVAATIDGKSGTAASYLDGQLVGGNAAAEGDVPSTMRGYTLQRYVQACSGRGTWPIKFNGGLFTVEPKAMGKPWNADWRAWGDCHWFQNVRHMYHPMLASGDWEMLEPFFELYQQAVPLAEARTRLYHQASGSYFPETMTVWGTYSNGDYGWNRAGHQPKDVLCPYWQYAWNQGPELVALLLDRWDYTRDEAFARARLLPLAETVLAYFDTRFKKSDEGRFIIDPTQAVETYWHGVVNDLPTVAGLRNITTRLCALPERLTTPAQRASFARLLAACPPVPVEEVAGVRKLAPAEKYNPKTSNCENPELYAIWPFRLYGVGRPDLEVARAAYARRKNHLPTGWGYDGNCAAVLGLTDEAARILKIKCANSHRAYRWPATWGPNFDWLPDQNHGGNLLETTQLMLLQSVGDKLYLLPAWPRTWDVEFKLRAPGNTTVECVWRAGKLDRLVVTPESRRADVVLPE